ncbi:hypothetical protein [Sedimentitalea todarodis]|uniref:Porin domain-containing protein n=1 Tax=Sedimentitalea todarodis TaxID=1631240 RepID=A0ABU3V7Z5_9RHOB|nr:hypothetical protein [Sedimentitalea todarodis]MDU9002284.1 hypothetical protein [Sedimentitalea todarodis]
MTSGPTLSLKTPIRFRAVWWSVLLTAQSILFVQAPLHADERKLDLTPFSDGTDDWRTRQLFTGALVTFYGQFSPAILNYDDGALGRTYAPVGNSNKTSRLGLRWHIRQLGSWSPIFRAEIGVTPRPSNSVNLNTSQNVDWLADETNLRKLELILKHPRLGVLTFGQGSMATDSITEVDYSGTKVAAYSDVAAVASAQFLRFADGTLSIAQLGEFIDNFEGSNITGTYADGDRKMRARYDSPEFNGLIFSAAIGNEVLHDDGGTNADAALTYERDLGDYKFASGIGYSWKPDARVLSGSMSGLHKASGLNLTVAVGGQDDGGDFSYVKLGLLRSYWAVGETALSIDFYQGNDIYSAGSRSRSVGLAFVQSFDRLNVQGFALLRRYSFDARDADFLDSTAMMTGLRWVF